MSLLGELLGPCRVGFYLFGCFILFFPPSPPLPLPAVCRGVVGLAGSLFPSLSGENSGKGERLQAHGCMGGPRSPLDPPPRGPAAAAAADRAPGERVSTGGPAPAPAAARSLRIAPQAELGGRGQVQGQGRGQGQGCAAKLHPKKVSVLPLWLPRAAAGTGKVKLEPPPTCSLGGLVESRLGSGLGKAGPPVLGPARRIELPVAVPAAAGRGQRAEGQERGWRCLSCSRRCGHSRRRWDLSGASCSAPAPAAAAALRRGIALTPGMRQGSCSSPRSWKRAFLGRVRKLSWRRLKKQQFGNSSGHVLLVPITTKSTVIIQLR